jgi:hypothetical protein
MFFGMLHPHQNYNNFIPLWIFVQQKCRFTLQLEYIRTFHQLRTILEPFIQIVVSIGLSDVVQHKNIEMKGELGGQIQLTRNVFGRTPCAGIYDEIFLLSLFTANQQFRIRYIYGLFQVLDCYNSRLFHDKDISLETHCRRKFCSKLLKDLNHVFDNF